MIINSFLFDSTPLGPQLAFSTINKSTTINLSNLNRTATATNGVNVSAFANSGSNSGKRYCEFLIEALSASDGYPLIGAANNIANTENYCGGIISSFGMVLVNGTLFYQGVTYSSDLVPSPATVGSTVSVCIDIPNGKAWMGINNNYPAGANPATGTNPLFTGLTGTWWVGITTAGIGYGGYDSATMRGNSQDWIYTPPSGYIGFSE